MLSIAPLIAQAIHEVFEDGSVTSLFDDLTPLEASHPNPVSRGPV